MQIVTCGSTNDKFNDLIIKCIHIDDELSSCNRAIEETMEIIMLHAFRLKIIFH